MAEKDQVAVASISRVQIATTINGNAVGILKRRTSIRVDATINTPHSAITSTSIAPPNLTIAWQTEE